MSSGQTPLRLFVRRQCCGKIVPTKVVMAEMPMRQGCGWRSSIIADNSLQLRHALVYCRLFRGVGWLEESHRFMQQRRRTLRAMPLPARPANDKPNDDHDPDHAVDDVTEVLLYPVKRGSSPRDKLIRLFQQLFARQTLVCHDIIPLFV